MANITKRGEHSYRLTVCYGYNVQGKKLYKQKTIKVDPKLTPKQLKKELRRQSVLFEEEVLKGTYADGEKITFGKYAEKWYNEYAVRHLAPSTLPKYRVRLNERIIPELGHIKLTQLQPHHLEGFYNYLTYEGVRLDFYYRPTEHTVSLLLDIVTSQCEVEIGISLKTFLRLKKGERTKIDVANKVCKYLNIPLDKAFIVEHKKATLSSKTIKHHHDLISTILSDAKRNNLILNNPAERVKVPKVKKAPLKYYDEDQLTKLFEALETAPMKYKAIVYLAVDTGLRIGEIAGLEVSHVNLDKGILQVVQQRQRVEKELGGVIVTEPKTDSGIRVVSLSHTIVNILREYISYLENYRSILGDAWIESPFLFRHENGEAMSPSRPYQWFVDFTQQHGLPAIPFHGLRHTNASLLISEDTDIVTLSNRLGHSDKNTTLNIYAHQIRSKEKQAANKMDKFYPKPIRQDIDE